MSAARSERLAPEDAARLHMGVRANPMRITAMLVLDRAVDRARLEARLKERLLRHPRFRQRVVEPLFGPPRWEDDPDFDVANHLHRIDRALMPETLAPSAIDELVSDLASLPLSDRHPLWRVHLIDGEPPALLLIVHHALADGSSLLALLSELADEHVVRLAALASKATTPRTRIRQIASGAVSASRLAIRRADPETSLKPGPLAGRKHLAVSRDLVVRRLHETAHVLGTTVTGLLLVAIAGVCGAELDGARVPRALHALVPVDLRAGAARSLGNRFASVVVPLPIGVADVRDRVRVVQRAMHDVRSGGGSAAGRVATAAGAVSAFVERLGVALFSRRASVVVSSVRGPERRVSLCGAVVRDIVVWAPAPGTIGLSVTLMSYAGHALVGVAVDSRLSTTARRFIGELEREIDDLTGAGTASADRSVESRP